MQRSQLEVLGQAVFGRVGLLKSSMGINVDESIQLRVESRNLSEMRFDQFHWRQFFLSNLLSHGNGGKEG